MADAGRHHDDIRRKPLTATSAYAVLPVSPTTYQMVTSTYQLVNTTAYSGTNSYYVAPDAGTPTTLPVQVRFEGGDLPVRFDLDHYTHVSFAWKGSGATALSIGFMTINLDNPSQTALLRYYAGPNRSDPYQIQVASSPPLSWMHLTESILSDAQNATGWQHIAIAGLFLGAQAGGGYFDLVQMGP